MRLLDDLAREDALVETTSLFPGVTALAVRLGPHLDKYASALTPAELPDNPARVAKRTREMIGGRVLARVLMHRMGIEPQPLLRGLDRAPIWPKGVVGSITHTEEICAIAMAASSEFSAVGIDIEPRIAVREPLWDRIARNDEMTRMAPLDGIKIRWLFCAKEAFFKAQFGLTSRMLYHHDVSVVPLDDDGAFRVKVSCPQSGAMIDAAGQGHSGFDHRYLTAIWTVDPLESS